MIRRNLASFVLASAVLGGAAPDSLSGPPEPSPGIRGIWGTETTFGPQVRGDLTLARSPARWTARIAGFEVEARAEKDGLQFDLPGGQGGFRGRVIPERGAVEGFWLQPAGLVADVPYATPVTLRRVDENLWRGAVAPLDDRFSLYVLLEEQTDGLMASFRNPEANQRGGAPRFRVRREGSLLRFVDPDHEDHQFTGMLDGAGRRLTLQWPGLGVPLVLTPRTADQAVGLYPRTPKGVPYAYRRPPAGDDGWNVAGAAEVGMDEAALAQVVERIVRTDPAVASAPLIHSILVARHGKLVLEEYFFGFDAERVHDLRSASKTLTSVMVGAALEQGASWGVHTPAVSLLPRYAPLAHPDPRKAQITLAHLLTHSSGLACDDNDDDSPGNEDRMEGQTEQPDWYRYTLDLPLVHAPGTTYAYCSGGVNLVGGALRNATGVFLPEFFARHVAGPLQIRGFHMNLMPGGEAYSGGGVYMRPRDLLKFGQAFLDKGVWNGRRVVSPAWVERSTARQVDTSPDSSDGYGWHRHALRSGDRAYAEYEANGNGGQFLIVLPELDLTVVFTAGNYGSYPVWRKFRDELLPRDIIPAVTGR